MDEKTAARANVVPRPTVSTICPVSGIDTGIERELDPELGAVSLDELETLVRNEWRRRLGSSSYRRKHSRALVRALIVCALDPDSPVRSAVATQLVLWELTSLGTCGLGREDIKREFQVLIHAVRHVLANVGLGSDPSHDMADQIARKLDEMVEWLAAVSSEGGVP